jgi:hypothetical protein
MKIIMVFLFTTVTFINITFGQVEFDKNDGYFQALKIHLDYLNQIQFNDKVIFIREEDYIGEYSGELNGFNLIMIDNKEIFRKTRNEKVIKVLKIKELIFKDGNLETSIIIYEVSRNKNNYKFIETIKSKISVTYDCLDNQFQYKIIAN